MKIDMTMTMMTMMTTMMVMIILRWLAATTLLLLIAPQSCPLVVGQDPKPTKPHPAVLCQTRSSPTCQGPEHVLAREGGAIRFE